MKDNWQTLWQSKGHAAPETPALLDLIRADGFDSGAGDHTEDSWLAFAAMVIDRLGIGPGKSVLEVGCGAGAFLLPAHQRGARVFGIDYSPSLLRLAAHAIAPARFAAASADRLPFAAPLFDAIISHSVFQYFPDLAYAETVLSGMARLLKNNGKIAVLDVNDAAKQADYRRIRQGSLSAAAYAAKYRDYPHLFFAKSWFEDIARRLGLRATLEDQAIEGYGNSQLRYNVFLEC
jgi:ubiquinone/menaquinone biosynthesis C-methylase UbiE